MNYAFQIRENLLRAKHNLLDIKIDLKFDNFLRAAIKAGFNPDQPRDDNGRWTYVTGGGTQVSTSEGFLTGIPTIDETSAALSDTLLSVVESLGRFPDMSPQLYGMLVHAEFGVAVKAQGLPGVGDIERTFSLDDADPSYGLASSVRTDVVLRNIQGDIIAIYDVKTGERPMSRARANELREKTRAAPNTPIFELNVERGVSRKFLRLRRQCFSLRRQSALRYSKGA